MKSCTECGTELPIERSGEVCTECGGVAEINDSAKWNTLATEGTISAEATDLNYADIKWFRKRWFVIVCALFCMPIAILIAATGEIYFQKNGVVYKLNEKHKRLIILALSLIIMTNLLPLIVRSIL